MGGFESGLVAHWFGPVISVISGGIGTIAVVVMWARLFPGLRTLGTLTDIPDSAEAEAARIASQQFDAGVETPTP